MESRNRRRQAARAGEGHQKARLQAGFDEGFEQSQGFLEEESQGQGSNEEAGAKKEYMIVLRPTVLEGHGVRLEPLTADHLDGLVAAAGDGRLWELWFTSVPEPGNTAAYIADALDGQRAGHMLPWAVREQATGLIAGSTRFHDIVATIDRVEIGYTWYGNRWQRTHVNTACKLLLLTYAFEQLGCKVVGFRTDNFNFASQRAIQALGARKDGVIRHHHPRRDGTVRDSVMYSILAGEWPDVKKHLAARLVRARP
jgi:N-acetyltransferase